MKPDTGDRPIAADHHPYTIKTRFHRWLLGLMMLFLMPGTFLACLLMIGLVGSGFDGGFEGIYLLLALFLLVPLLFIGWGFYMLRELKEGFHYKLRRQLLAYYLIVFVYCAVWLFSTASRASDKFAIFPLETQIAGSLILITPVLITLFSNPEAKRIWSPSAGENLHLHGHSDRFVAWLASRFR